MALLIKIGLSLLILLQGPLCAGPRLISVSPQVTELLFQLKKGGDLVGTTQPADYPSAAKSIPSIGSLLQPNLEKAVLLKPDWVVADYSFARQEFFLKPLKERGVRIFSFHLESPELLIEESRRFLKEVYQQEFSSEVMAAENCLRSLNTGGYVVPHKFIVFVWMNPPIVLGRHTFLSKFLEKFLGTNAVSERLPTPYPQVSVEWILNQKLDHVLYLGDSKNDLEALKQQSVNWWPGRVMRFDFLASDFFARASFTPFYRIKELPFLDLKQARGCESL